MIIYCKYLQVPHFCVCLGSYPVMQSKDIFLVLHSEIIFDVFGGFIWDCICGCRLKLDCPVQSKYPALIIFFWPLKNHFFKGSLPKETLFPHADSFIPPFSHHLKLYSIPLNDYLLNIHLVPGFVKASKLLGFISQKYFLFS